MGKRLTLRRRLWGGAVGLLGSCVVVACLFDPEDRCDANELYTNGDRCVCQPGFVRLDGVCSPCGDNERVVGGACECVVGFTRGENGDCAENNALGAGCDTTTDPCEDERASYCHAEGSTAGYCTIRGCDKSADCPGLWACDVTSEPSYCKRPPSGLGEPCSEAADCRGFEASYCETIQSNTCIQSDCELNGNDCFLGWSCCDLTSVGLPTLCVTEGSCPF